MTVPLNTVGLAQIAKLTGLSRHTIVGRKKRRSLGFPPEVAPRRWRTEDIVGWLKHRQQKRKGTRP